MKWALGVMTLLFAGLIGGAFYMQSTDPRPAGLAMQAALTAELEGWKKTTPAEASFDIRAQSYLDLAQGFARVELVQGTDADLKSYAERLLARPEVTGNATPDAANLDAVHAQLLSQLEASIRREGEVPDQRFVDVMLPLEMAMAELGRLSDGAKPETALRTADEGTLMAASAVKVLGSWSSGQGHTH